MNADDVRADIERTLGALTELVGAQLSDFPEPLLALTGDGAPILSPLLCARAQLLAALVQLGPAEVADTATDFRTCACGEELIPEGAQYRDIGSGTTYSATHRLPGGVGCTRRSAPRCAARFGPGAQCTLPAGHIRFHRVGIVTAMGSPSGQMEW